MTTDINLTPFENALSRAAEFGENVCQTSVWALAMEKLQNVEDPESDEAAAIDTFLTALVSVPGTVTAEA